MMQNELLAELTPNKSLPEIQAYIKKVIAERGFAGQAPQAAMLLLLEEVGELAKAVRKDASGMSVDPARLYKYESVKGEAADVFIVLLSILNELDIDLYSALIEKERINCARRWEVNNTNPTP